MPYRTWGQQTQEDFRRTNEATKEAGCGWSPRGEVQDSQTSSQTGFTEWQGDNRGAASSRDWSQPDDSV